MLPRSRRLTLLLALDFSEVADDPMGLARYATERKFYIHASYDGGVSISIREPDAIEGALPLIRQALAIANE